MSPPAAARRPGRLGLSVAAAALAAALAGCAISPQAVPAEGGYAPYAPAAAAEEVALRDEFEASPQETHAYWSNPDLFAQAEGVQYTTPENGIAAGAGDPATGAYVAPTVATPAAESASGFGDVPLAVPFDGQGLSGAATGRLYLEFEGSNSVCSASVVNSENRSVVVTAAHCLLDFGRSKASPRSALFVPADRGWAQQRPYGVWAAVEYLIPQNFLDNAEVASTGAVSGSGWTTDYAFLVMETRQGQRIQDVTGGLGIAFGVPVQQLTQLGYPTAAPFDGSSPYLCASTAWQQGWAAGYQHLCDMTPGSSGGAWLAYYDRQLGAGYVVAVTSTGTSTLAVGSVLGKGALELYGQAQGAA